MAHFSSNYILRLRSRVEELEAKLQQAEAWKQDFRVHLASAKFQGTDPDGSRRDWIATGDVAARLAHLDTSGD